MGIPFQQQLKKRQSVCCCCCDAKWAKNSQNYTHTRTSRFYFSIQLNYYVLSITSITFSCFSTLLIRCVLIRLSVFISVRYQFRLLVERLLVIRSPFFIFSFYIYIYCDRRLRIKKRKKQLCINFYLDLEKRQQECQLL